MDGQPDNSSELRMATAQKPYSRTFGFLPMGAWMWHPDTLTFWHRLRGRMGTEPPIYNEELAQRSDRAMQLVMQRKGYLDATVTHRTSLVNGKARVTYDIQSNRPRRLANIHYESADTALLNLLEFVTTQNSLQPGQLLDRNRLESERQRITTQMRESGYWDFDKEDVSFIADTLKGQENVDLTILIHGHHRLWRIRKVHFLANFNILSQSGEDSIMQHFRELDQPGYDLTYAGDQCYLRDRRG